MKKIIFGTILLSFASSSFAQHSASKPVLPKPDYLQKSKKQKKLALLFLGGGTALIITSLVIPNGTPSGYQFDPITGGFYEGHKNDGIKGALILTGAVSMLGSIPFFIAAGKNKRKANQASVFIDIEKSPFLQKMMFSNRSFPSAGVRINL